MLVKIKTYFHEIIEAKHQEEQKKAKYHLNESIFMNEILN